MSAANRAAKILCEATTYFADHGFQGSTRGLADKMGVRQALIYKYFDNKAALIDAVLFEQFDQNWQEAWNKESADKRGVDLIAKFFETHSSDPLRLRLFLRAVLDRVYFPAEIVRATGLDILR